MVPISLFAEGWLFTVPLCKSDCQEGFHAKCVAASMIFRGNVFKRSLIVHLCGGSMPSTCRKSSEPHWSCSQVKENSLVAQGAADPSTLSSPQRYQRDTLAPKAHQSPYHETMRNESGVNTSPTTALRCQEEGYPRSKSPSCARSPSSSCSWYAQT